MLLLYLQDHIMSVDNAGSVLQLAMNCSTSSTAAVAASRIPYCADSAAYRMPEILQPAVARRLLLTAATRQHTEAVCGMVALPVMQQHLDAATLEVMPRQLLRHDWCIRLLCQLPVAAELSTDAVTRLLLAAYEECQYDAGRFFCELNVAQQLSSDQTEGLLHMLMQTGSRVAHDISSTWEFWQAVYRLPGAMQLDSSAVVRLLRTAICMDDADASEDLVELPAAADISSADVASLLHEAFAEPADVGIAYATLDIMQIPAFQQLNSAEVAQLLHAAAQHYSDGDETREYKGLTSLCELAAAQELSSEQVLQPLQLVVHSDVCTEALCKLPAMQQLSSETVAQLLQAAIVGKSERSFELLCALPAVQQLGSVAVGELLLAALSAHKYQCTKALWDLPATQQLDSGAVAQLMQAAVTASSIECIARIVPAAVQLNSDQVASALTAAARFGVRHRDSGNCFQRLCELPAAAMLSSTQVAAAVESALLCSAGVSCVNLLLKLPAAAHLDNAQVAQLLQAAATHHKAACMEQLCKLPAAGQLSGKQLVQALEAAAKRKGAACTKQLCKLPAATQLSSKTLQGLLQTAQQHTTGSICVKCCAPLRGLLVKVQKA
jgi:hypothetical protein